MANLEDIVNRYVDTIMAFRKLAEETNDVLKEQDPAVFCQAVAEEMRRRGVSEDDIVSTVKGMIWGMGNWSSLQQEIEATPDLLHVLEKLKGGQTGSVEGSSRENGRKE